MLRILLALFFMSRNWEPRPKLDVGGTKPKRKMPFI